MKPFNDARALIADAKTRQLPALADAYRAATDSRALDSGVLIATKQLVDGMRAALDYVANGLYESAIPKPPRRRPIYFPFARETQTADDFLGILQNNMPDYSCVRPAVANALGQLQHYANPAFKWMPRFVQLSNLLKHHHLGNALPFVVYGMQITSGSDQIIVQGGKWVVGPEGTHVAGQPISPGTYDCDHLPPLPSGTVVEVLRPSEVVFADDVSVRVYPFLKQVVSGVEHVVETLAPMA